MSPHFLENQMGKTPVHGKYSVNVFVKHYSFSVLIFIPSYISITGLKRNCHLACNFIFKIKDSLHFLVVPALKCVQLFSTYFYHRFMGYLAQRNYKKESTVSLCHFKVIKLFQSAILMN